jgi:acyl-coenzyme A thioesterase PaaI-like protein
MSEPIERSREGWGRWSGSADALITYRYLGCRSEVIDIDRARGMMPLRSDMRWSGGLLGTPLAVAMLDTAGINIDGRWFGALTHVVLMLHDGGGDIARVRIDGEVSRMTKRQIFTEARLADDSEPDRVIASGAADWANLGEVGPDWRYLDPGTGVPDAPPMPPLIEPYLVEPAGRGGYVIPRLDPAIGTELLHHGPQMAALEWHAMDAVGNDHEVRLSAFDVRFLRGASRAPFATRLVETRPGDGERWARVDLIDQGGHGDVVSRAILTYQTSGRECGARGLPENLSVVSGASS